MAHRSDYLHHIHNSHKVYVDRACKDLADLQFDSIAFTGVSGAMMGPVIAYKLGKSMIPVRKKTDECHAPFKVEAPEESCKYVIVDDQVCTGSTINRILDGIEDEYPTCDHKCVGVYAYNKTFPYEEPPFKRWSRKESQYEYFPIIPTKSEIK